MIEGLMQHDFPLTVRHVLDRMRCVGERAEVVTATDGQTERRTSYPELAQRADRLATALRGLGVRPGDRVGTLMWNTQEHLELYLAVPSMGAVLHTINVRLFPAQISYIVDHAADKVLVVDASLVDGLAEVLAHARNVEHVILVGDTELPGAMHYEALLACADDDAMYPELDERTAAGLCYTSGTTGDPKGVLYSHRSTVLHALAQCTTDAIGIGARDRALPLVPMFHVNAWGIPYACALTGASLVMPGRFLSGDAVARLIEGERVTVSAGVPTVWSQVLDVLDREPVDVSSLRLILGGGVRVPLSLIDAFADHGVKMIQGWGMTETSPVCAVAHPPDDATDDERAAYLSSGGRLLPLVEARAVAEDGTVVPRDGVATGELEVRGPWVAAGYYETDAPDRFRDGWLRTGDIASIDARGYLRISDRSKDMIKSGGEWISSVDLEQALMAHEGVIEAAVIARPDPKWSERPLACVVRAGDGVTPDMLRDHLAGHVARWWIPEHFAFVSEIPKTSIGKLDKKMLRAQLAEGRLG